VSGWRSCLCAKVFLLSPVLRRMFSNTCPSTHCCYFVHTLKWVGVLTRNFVKSTEVNAHAQRAICFTRKNNWRAALIVARSYQPSFHRMFELSVKLNGLRMLQSFKTLTFHRANSFNGMIPLSAYIRRINGLQYLREVTLK
jgi:hypothetical protein